MLPSVSNHSSQMAVDDVVEFGAFSLEVVDESLMYLHGPTYKIKDVLKSRGARWDPLKKAWRLNEAIAGDMEWLPDISDSGKVLWRTEPVQDTRTYQKLHVTKDIFILLYSDKTIAVGGKTYPMKISIKTAGAVWNAQDKMWTVARDDLKDVVDAILEIHDARMEAEPDYAADNIRNPPRSRKQLWKCCILAEGSHSDAYCPLTWNCPLHGKYGTGYTGD